MELPPEPHSDGSKFLTELEQGDLDETRDSRSESRNLIIGVSTLDCAKRITDRSHAVF